MTSVVCLSVVCNVRAPYSVGWNFRQFFFPIWYLDLNLKPPTKGFPWDDLRKIFGDVNGWPRYQTAAKLWLHHSNLMVHIWIAGDVPINIKFALEVTHPFRIRRFRQIPLNSASAVRLSKKVQLLLIGSRYTFHRAYRWTACVTPKSSKGLGWLKTRICTFGVAFHFFIAGNRRHFKFVRRL